MDIDQDPGGLEKVFSLKGMRITPTIVFPDGTILAEPSGAELEVVLKRYKA